MQIRIHKPADADAVDAGSLAFASIALAFAEAKLISPPQPDYDPALFTKLWEADALGFAGAWLDGKMIGCRVVVVSPSILSPAYRIATTVSIYVSPEHRKQGVATQLIVQGDNHLKSLGVNGCAVMSMANSPMLQHVGYVPKTTFHERLL